jgi:ribA/ribD-fused uncharacterized protein
MINLFRGSNSFLSNFHPLEGSTLHGYPTVENFFQAMKCHDETYRKGLKLVTPAVAKKLGRRCKLRDNWEVIKFDVMIYALRKKFTEPRLHEKLLATGNQTLVEGNYWNDTYWGVNLKTGNGENNLGKLLMQVRYEIELNDNQEE